MCIVDFPGKKNSRKGMAGTRRSREAFRANMRKLFEHGTKVKVNTMMPASAASYHFPTKI